MFSLAEKAFHDCSVLHGAALGVCTAPGNVGGNHADIVAPAVKEKRYVVFTDIPDLLTIYENRESGTTLELTAFYRYLYVVPIKMEGLPISAFAKWIAGSDRPRF